MKRIFLFAAVMLMISPAVMAQSTTFKVDKDALVKAIERSDKDMENPKRAQRGQTWLDRGQALYSAANPVGLQIYPGMPTEMLMAILGKGVEMVNKPLAFGKTFQVAETQYADIYVMDNMVQFWVDKTNVYPGAADKAYEAYKKAGELDAKLTPKAKEGMVSVADIYRMQANARYNFGENIPAAENFWKAYQLQMDPIVNVIDSNSVFNAGYLYTTEKQYDKAIPILEEAVSKEVWADGSVAYFLSWAYLQTNQFPKAKEILTKGFELFPENTSIVDGLINYYSMSGDDFAEISSVLESAVQRDPTNLALWTGLGQAHLSMKDTDKSIAFFTRFAQQFPNDFQAQFYLGDSWIEKGEALLKEAQEKAAGMSNAQREEAMAKVSDAYRNSLPALEAAYKIQPDEIAVVQRLARSYYRIKEEAGMEEKFNKYNDIYEKMEKERSGQ